MSKLSPETINIIKMWIGKTPPNSIIENNNILNTTPNTPVNTPLNTTPNTPVNTPLNTTPNTPIISNHLDKVIISPNTNLYLKNFISKTPPSEFFQVKRKKSLDNFKL